VCSICCSKSLGGARIHTAKGGMQFFAFLQWLSTNLAYGLAGMTNALTSVHTLCSYLLVERLQGRSFSLCSRLCIGRKMGWKRPPRSFTCEFFFACSASTPFHTRRGAEGGGEVFSWWRGRAVFIPSHFGDSSFKGGTFLLGVLESFHLRTTTINSSAENAVLRPWQATQDHRATTDLRACG